MKRNKKIYLSEVLSLVAILFSLSLSSCNIWRETVYFQDLDRVVLRNMQTESAIRIQSGDQLTIMVFGPDKYLIVPYNQTLNSVSESSLGSGGTRESQLPYDVDNDGYIKFPVLGKIKVSGLTTDELKEKLLKLLEKEINDVTIFVAVDNFRISVLGDVKEPGCFSIKNNRCTFLEALSRAGDCNLTADKRNVCLLRMENGKVKHYYYDLTNSQLLDTKNLYLKQNDVIIVPPSRTNARAKSTDSNSRIAIISICGVLVSLTGVLVKLLK